MTYNRKDKFYQKAKVEGYVSRSAYKLIELDKRFGILKPGRKIVDLGCAPGGWLQVAEKFLVGAAPRGRPGQPQGVAPTIIGIDLLPLQYQPSETVQFIQGDFLHPANQQEIIDALGENGEQGSGFASPIGASPSERGVRGRQWFDLAHHHELVEWQQSPRFNADWVLSDMSPNLSGVKFRDTFASTELCEGALEFAKKVLKKGGGLVVKIFPGPDFEPFKKKMKENFQKISTFIPESTRKSSTEVYLVATGLR